MSIKKFSPKEIFIPVLVLFLICLVSSGLLAYTNSLTKDKIASIDTENKAKAMAVVMDKAASYGEEKTDGDISWSSALDKDGKTIGYVVSTTVNGYGGDIDVMVGINNDGTINKAKVVSADDETPGLGQNTKKDSFIGQFSGKSGQLTVVKTTPSSDDEIQAVTSATISSKAVTKAVNSCLDYFNNNLKECE